MDVSRAQIERLGKLVDELLLEVDDIEQRLNDRPVVYDYFLFRLPRQED